jgi:hypothetical protein
MLPHASTEVAKMGRYRDNFRTRAGRGKKSAEAVVAAVTLG